MAFNAGNAFITVSPDMSKFQDDVKAKIAGTPDASVLVTADTAKLTADLDEATRARKAEIDPEVAKDPWAQSVADLDEAAKDRTAKIDVSADVASARAAMDSLAKPRKVTVTADADTTAAEAKLTALTKKPWTVTIKEKIDKVDDKLPGTLATLAGAGALALAPDVTALAAGLTLLGAGFAAAGADAGAFGVIAKGMFSDVTAAQKALTTAQAAYAKADTSKARTAALKAEAAATAKLTPAEKELFTELTALQGAWKKLSQAEQPAVGAAIAPWLQTATDGMKLLSPLITDAGNAIELLGNEADAAIKSPFWTKFSTVLGQTGEEALQVFGTAVGSVADGLAHLFVTFAPDIDNVLPLIDKLAAAFDTWAKSVSDKGLNDFLTKTFSPSNLAALKSDGQNLVDLLKSLATASAQMSGLAFGGLTNVLKVLGSLTPTEIEALTALFLAIKAVSAISSAVSAVSSIVGGIKGLLGGAATTAESAAEGTAAGEAGGAAAATAFTATFSAEVTAALAGIFTEIGTEGSAEAGTAGTAWGTAAAAAFGTAFGAEDALGITAGLTAIGVEGATEAGVAGAAMGSAMAAAFTAAFDAEGVAEIGASLGTAGIGAAIAAGLIGAALGAALGLGFKVALAATGIGSSVTTIENDVKSAASSANTWLQPAGQQAADGFGTGFLSQASKVQADVAQVKGWTTAGAAGSSAWLQPGGQQAGQGFISGFGGEHAAVNSAAAQIKSWVTSALPNPASWLVNIGVDAAQGLINGILSLAGSVESAIVGLIPSPIRGAVTAVLGLPGFATGTPSAPAGWAWVGEQGPELVHFSGGEQVKTNAASLSMLSGMATAQSLSALGVPSIAGPGSLPGVTSPLQGGPMQLQVSYVTPAGDAVAGLVQGFQFHIQGQYGGDAQAALGQGPVRVQ